MKEHKTEDLMSYLGGITESQEFTALPQKKSHVVLYTIIAFLVCLVFLAIGLWWALDVLKMWVK